MRWITAAVLTVLAMNVCVASPVQAMAKAYPLDTRLAHTGVLCQSHQSLKKQHPSQRIYYETVDGKRCYHVHVKSPTTNSASSWVTPRGVYSDSLKSRSEDVLQYYYYFNVEKPGRF